MNIFLSALKEQVNILSGLLLLFILAGIFFKFNKKRIANMLIIAGVTLFLLCSTSYLPEYLAKQLERKYPPLDVNLIKNDTDKIYIHVLGSGYNLDSSLPANARLGTVALSRLIEAVRLYKLLNNSIVVCSGGSPLNMETQAEVTKKAVIMLGVDSKRTALLNTPLTTLEEAKDLAKLTGTNAPVIIVTDAIHMPRAMDFFSRQGLNPKAAPTNYRVPVQKNSSKIKFWPHTENIGLMDAVLHEYIGSLKAAF